MVIKNHDGRRNVAENMSRLRVSTAPADDPAPLVGGASAATVMTTFVPEGLSFATYWVTTDPQCQRSCLHCLNPPILYVCWHKYITNLFDFIWWYVQSLNKHCSCKVRPKGGLYILHIRFSRTWKTGYIIEPSHKSRNASVKYPKMHDFVAEICTHAHISVTTWNLVRNGTGALWDLWDCSIECHDVSTNWHYFTLTAQNNADPWGITHGIFIRKINKPIQWCVFIPPLNSLTWLRGVPLSTYRKQCDTTMRKPRHK